MNIPYRKPLEELTVGETIKNLTFMLGQASIMSHVKTVVHYVGLNYEAHLNHLADKRQYKTACYYREQWDKITGAKP